LTEAVTEKEMYDVCVVEYTDRDLDEARVLENARLLWLRRHKEQMWLPPEELYA